MVKEPLPSDDLEATLRGLPRALRAVGRVPVWAKVWAQARTPRSVWDFPLLRASASLVMLTFVLATLWPAGIGSLGVPTAAQIGIAPAPINPAQTQVIATDAAKVGLTSPLGVTIGAEAAATPQPFATPGPRR